MNNTPANHKQREELAVLQDKTTMLSFLKTNPLRKLETKRRKLLEEAMHIQRSGDLKKYAFHIEIIAKLEKEIEALQSAKH